MAHFFTTLHCSSFLAVPDFRFSYSLSSAFYFFHSLPFLLFHIPSIATTRVFPLLPIFKLPPVFFLLSSLYCIFFCICSSLHLSNFYNFSFSLFSPFSNLFPTVFTIYFTDPWSLSLLPPSLPFLYPPLPSCPPIPFPWPPPPSSTSI